MLVIDTREQKPLCRKVKGLVSVVDTLHHGDYSIRGFENAFGIERKQSSDFYSYIGKERKRTVEKLKALGDLEFSALVVELSYDDLCLPNMYSRITPETVRQFLCSVRVRYGVHVFHSHKRQHCEQFVLDQAIKFYRIKHRI